MNVVKFLKILMNQLKRNDLHQKLNLCPREEEKYIYNEKSVQKWKGA